MLDAARKPSRCDHLPYQVRPLDEIDWETIRWPGETGKMLFHPSPEQPIAPNACILRPAAVDAVASAEKVLWETTNVVSASRARMTVDHSRRRR
jgi:hypothetical protein